MHWCGVHSPVFNNFSTIFSNYRSTWVIWNNVDPVQSVSLRTFLGQNNTRTKILHLSKWLIVNFSQTLQMTYSWHPNTTPSFLRLETCFNLKKIYILLKCDFKLSSLINVSKFPWFHSSFRDLFRAKLSVWSRCFHEIVNSFQ